MFIASLFITAKAWKQSRCPAIGKLVKTNCSTSRQLNVIQQLKNEISNHEKIWRNFKCILLSERN